MGRLDIRSVLVACLLVIIGVGLGRMDFSSRAQATESTFHGSGEFEQAEIGFFSLTSPFLESLGERDYDPRLRRARAHILNHIEALQEADPTLRVSVYARDLLNGPWIGIDARMPFQPASLMKVSVLSHSLARMESDPGLRERAFLYHGPAAMPGPDNLLDRPAEERMEPGRSYSFEELLERMIAYSDNHAKDLILTGVETSEIDDFMLATGIPKIVEGSRAVMNVRAYGALFRILYNSTLFSRPSSEYALSLLSRGRFKDGIRAPIPPGITVASKFAIHRDPDDPERATQLHECGIVYAEAAPYVLCVMTSSGRQTVEELAKILAEISEITFTEH